LATSGTRARGGGPHRSGRPSPRGAASSHLPWVLALVVIVAGGIPAIAIARRGPSVPQPVAFNHRKHTQDLGLECAFCHPHVRTGAHSGLPNATTCSMCHSTAQGTSTEAARVTELLAAGDSLRFNKLFGLPAHVFYTHRRHVAVAELECTSCHGPIAETERPPSRALVQVDMDFCIRCHRQAGASLDCNACHR